MPYVNNNEVRIHYQVLGNGPPVVLLHGLFANIGDWHEAGYVKVLKDDFQVIAMDARGHGASDKPHDPKNYDMSILANDVTAILDHLNISKAHFYGYSYGARVGFGIMKYAVERFNSLILGGASPYKGPNASHDLFIQNLRAGVAAFSELLDKLFEPSLSGYHARRLSGDFDAYIASTIARRDWPNVDDALPNVTIPCMIYAGTSDGNYQEAMKAAKLMPNATFVSLPNLDHIQAFVRSDLVLPHIKKFLAEVSQSV